VEARRHVESRAEGCARGCQAVSAASAIGEIPSATPLPYRPLAGLLEPPALRRSLTQKAGALP
jgi:hypothetical protein